MADARTSADRPTRTRRLLRLLIGTSLFIVAGFLGRATIIADDGPSLIWPAIGVAGLWIGSGNRSTWPLDTVALAASTVLVTMSTGADLSLALIFVATNVVEVFAFVALTRAWMPGVWGFGGTESLHRVSDLGRLAVAACAAGFAGLAVGSVGIFLVDGHVHPGLLSAWWGRNTVALLVLSTLGILIGQPLAASGSLRAAARLTKEALTPASVGRFAEVVWLLAGTIALACLIFVNSTGEPLAFLLLVMSVWAGIRFSPIVVTVHGVVMGVVGVAFTLAGNGPFASVGQVYYRAVVAQAFVAMTVLTGLALAFSRAERDLANRQLAEARRSADERAQLLDAVLESMKEGVVVIEESGRVLVCNSAGRELVGLGDPGPYEELSAAAYGLFHGNGVPLTPAELPGARALAGETVPPEDLHVRAPSIPDGRVVEISAMPLTNEDPEAPRRAMVNVRDVTVDRQHRDTLASFAGVVAHDLFNPLTVVDGWTEALQDEFVTGAVAPSTALPMLARIQGAAAHMRMFIADLLAYTVAKDQSLRTGPVDLSAMVRDLGRLRADGPGSPLIQVDDHLAVWADQGLVRQLFDNLLGNAVKYVAPGVRPSITISGRVVGFQQEVRVTDNGIGIPAEERELIFESFHRAHRDYLGTGLGLAICHRIVDRHGGTIRVEAAPHGTGSTFVITLPVAPASAWYRGGQAKSDLTRLQGA